MKPALIAFLIGMAIELGHAQNYRTSHYSDDNGLPSPVLIDMAIDPSGKIWFLTRQGVAIFDRGEVKQFPLPPSLDSVKIHQIEIDAKGELHFASSARDGSLYHHGPKGWTIIPPPTGMKFSYTAITLRLSLTETESGPLIAYVNEGLLYFYQQGQWSSFDDGEARYGKVRRMTPQGEGFLAATTKGLYYLDPRRVEALFDKDVPDNEKELICMAADEKGTDSNGPVYTMSRTWISAFQKGKLRHVLPTPTQLTLGPEANVLMFLNEVGDLILADGDFIFHLNVKTRFLRAWNMQTGLIGNGASCFILDREHGLWIGGTQGVTRIAHRRFDNYTSGDGLPENEVSALLEWQPNRFLVGQNHSLSLFDKDGIKSISLPVKVKSRILEIKHEPDGGALVSSLGVGMLRLDPNLKASLLATESPVLLHSAERDREGVLWAAGPTNLYVYRAGAFRLNQESEPPSFASRRIQKLSAGRLVLSTYIQGIWVQEQRWRNYRAQSESANNVYTVIEDHRGRLLAGTKIGVFTVKGDALVRLDEVSVDRPVFALQEDRKHRLWVGTDKGVYRFGRGPKRHYTVINGLLANEINRGAFLQASDGGMWFGTIGGLAHYREALDFDPMPPSILLLEGTTADSRWPADRPQTLDADSDTLTFRYRAFSMEGKNSLWVRYRLMPYDTDWRRAEPATQQLAQYRRLPPGTYQFQIKAGSKPGNWSEPVSSGMVTVAKPLVQQPWFIAGAFILALLLGFSIFDYFASKRYSRFLQLQVSERTSELTSKNQLLLEQIQEKVAAESKIQALNEELEERVSQRTAQLEVLQRDLVENAHYAGMAEIATSMLHNVGNILNSISTSGFLLQQTLEHSKLPSLQRANDLLRPHVDHFEQRLRDDPKARDLLRFYLTLGDRMDGEHQLLRDQVHSLLERIDTIKDVVAQQHNYTSGVYQTETLPLEQLLETSLKIMEASLGSRDIAVVRQLEPIPPVNVQKTKIIHTMVNLLKNAAEAIMTSPTDRREIILHSWTANGSIFISITDSGSGIPLPLLGKIFNHGFTTKVNGNGFGLHSCANALKEMGGIIWAQNRKDASGAVFTIRLPVPGQNQPGSKNLQPQAGGEEQQA